LKRLTVRNINVNIPTVHRQQNNCKFSVKTSLLPTKLDGTERVNALSSIPSWKEVSNRNAITKTFNFQGFSEAFTFMTRMALVAEQKNHHPEWLQTNGIVEVTLSTHDCGGVSKNDIQMAKKMDDFSKQMDC